MLEAQMYETNCFVTLTYSDENLRHTSKGNPTLAPWDLQNWLKRFRKALVERSQCLKLPKDQWQRIRFFAVGEYGDESWRPHYHVAVFNFAPCARGRTQRRPGSGRAVWEGCCDSCELVGRSWGLGDIECGVLEAESAAYVAGYVTKKLTSVVPELDGRHPEFSRMSNRPGVGAGFISECASEFMKLGLDMTEADVPVGLRHGKKVLPLGRYLRKRWRKEIGRDEKCPPEVLEALKDGLRDVQEAAFDASESFKDAIKKKRAQATVNHERRQAVFKSKRTL